MRGDLLALLASLLALCWIAAGAGGGGTEEQTDEETAKRALIQHNEQPAVGVQRRRDSRSLMDDPTFGVDATKHDPRAKRSPQEEPAGEGHYC